MDILSPLNSLERRPSLYLLKLPFLPNCWYIWHSQATSHPNPQNNAGKFPIPGVLEVSLLWWKLSDSSFYPSPLPGMWKYWVASIIAYKLAYSEGVCKHYCLMSSRWITLTREWINGERRHRSMYRKLWSNSLVVLLSFLFYPRSYFPHLQEY